MSPSKLQPYPSAGIDHCAIFFDAEMKKIKKVYYVTRRKKGRNEHTKVPNAAMYSTHYAEKQLLCRLVQVLIIGQEHLDGW